VAELEQLALQSHVSPARVLPRHPRRIEPAAEHELDGAGFGPDERLHAVQDLRVAQLVHVVEDQPDRRRQCLQCVGELADELRSGIAVLPGPRVLQPTVLRHRRAAGDRGPDG
jgi:hypothetical protein